MKNEPSNFFSWFELSFQAKVTILVVTVENEKDECDWVPLTHNSETNREKRKKERRKENLPHVHAVIVLWYDGEGKNLQKLKLHLNLKRPTSRHKTLLPPSFWLFFSRFFLYCFATFWCESIRLWLCVSRTVYRIVCTVCVVYATT